MTGWGTIMTEVEIIEPGYKYKPTRKSRRVHDQERLFVQKWFECGFSQTKAAFALGHKNGHAHKWGNMMIRRESVQLLIKEQIERAMGEHQMTIDGVVKEVAKIAFANMGNYTRLVGEDRIIDLSQCTEDQLAAIKELTIEEYSEGRGEDARNIKRVKLQLHPKMDALDKLMRFLGAYVGKGDGDRPPGPVFNGPVNITQIAQMTPDAAAAEYRKMMEAPIAQLPVPVSRLSGSVDATSSGSVDDPRGEGTDGIGGD